VFLAHSTTQATNALLEGDVAPVGIVAIASGPAAALAAKQSRIDGIELAPGRTLHPGHRFIKGEALNEAAAAEAVRALQEEGAKVIVATSAFGVDDGSDEEAIRDAATALGLPVTCGHEISKLYGLATRTRTAVINASILPRMIETADMTQQSVREAGIAAPLMIMRGDGGVMDVNEMRRRPAMTMLSGPAASVAGALMHLRISDGIYFEVGGTSTNIGVIRNGRPTVKYARVGGHETYVSSLDVRVLGIAGGSLVRVADGRLVDVGPRSAHIAGWLTPPSPIRRYSTVRPSSSSSRDRARRPTMLRSAAATARAMRSPRPAPRMRWATPSPACTPSETQMQPAPRSCRSPLCSASRSKTRRARSSNARPTRSFPWSSSSSPSMGSTMTSPCS